LTNGWVVAPWSVAQVDALNRWQQADAVHSFTCGNDHAGDKSLVATKDGWICLHCDYKQIWAHESMLTLPSKFDWAALQKLRKASS